MEKYGPKVTRKFRERVVSSLAIGSTYGLASKWAHILKGFSPKAVAARIGASPRTVENWQDGANGPTWKHTVAMLNDDELGPLVLKAAGLDDLAKQYEINTLNRRIEALKTEEQKHRKHVHEIRTSLAVGSTSSPLDGGTSQQLRREVATTRGVVPRSD